MLTIGLTGGIGAGKSLVCDIFRHLNVRVYEADKRARLLMNEEAGIRDQIMALFGEKIYTPEGLDRKQVAKIVFHDEAMLEKVNSIVHPFVFRDFGIWLRKQEDQKYVIHEAAIIVESGAASLFDRIITVEAPEEIRIQRVIHRDGVGREEVAARVMRQAGAEERIKNAHYVIMNDGQLMIIPQVLSVHNRLLRMSGKEG